MSSNTNLVHVYQTAAEIRARLNEIEFELRRVRDKRHDLLATPTHTPADVDRVAAEVDALDATIQKLDNEAKKLTARWELVNDRRNAKRRRLRHNLNLVDRLLGNEVSTVNLVDEPGKPPGWTDGVIIWLNTAVLPDVDDLNAENLAVWLGANGHELGHNLFSPRHNSPLMKRIKDTAGIYPGLDRVENLVEDQREERLVIARFEPWRPFLIAAGVALAIDGPMQRQAASHLGELWPWLAGRTWLPASERIASRDAYPGDADELLDLIGQYQRLWDPGEAQVQEAMDILVAILANLEASGCWPSPEFLPTGCGEAVLKTAVNAEPVYADEDQVPSAGSVEDQAQLDDAEAEAGGEGEGDEADGDDTDDGDGVGTGVPNDDGDDVNVADGDGDGDSGDGDGDGDGDDTDTDDTDTESGGQGTQAGTTSTDEMTKAKDSITQAASEALQSDGDSLDEISKLRDALADVDKQYKSGLGNDPRESRYTRRPVPGAEATASELLTKEFDRIVHLAEPGWVRGSDHGRLNVDRYLQETLNPMPDYDTVFDLWKPGAEEAVDLDVAILLDVSGSMGWANTPNGETSEALIKGASKAVWQIRRAVHAADGTCVVYTFNTASYQVVKPGEIPKLEVYSEYPTGGGTNPIGALKDAFAYLRASTATHRMVILVTDGEWANKDGNREVITQMREQGITVLGVVLHPYINNPQHRMGPGPAREANIAVHRKDAQALVNQMGVDPALTAVYDNPLDMVEQFRLVAEHMLTTAMTDQGVLA